MPSRKLEVVGAGSGGIEQMVKYMQDCEVMWSLMRFEFGSGAFKRVKMVFLHFNGEETPVVRRGQANTMTGQVSDALRGEDGTFHASIQLYTTAEVTAENIMTKVMEYFVIDSMDSPVAMMKEYHEQLHREAEAARLQREGPPAAAAAEAAAPAAEEAAAEEAAAEEAPAEEAPEGLPPTGTSTKSMKKEITISVRPANNHLAEVGKPDGRLDWALVLPDASVLPLAGSGAGGLDEMRACAKNNEDKVLYGLMRATFGEGKMARPKWIMFHIMGENVKVVKRGRWNSIRPNMERKFHEFANYSVSIPDLGTEDLTPELITDYVGSIAVDDGDVAADKGETVDLKTFIEKIDKPGAPVAPEEAAPEPVVEEPELPTVVVEEEEVEISEDEDESPPNHDKTIEEVLAMVRVDCTANWALVAPQTGKK